MSSSIHLVEEFLGRVDVHRLDQHGAALAMGNLLTLAFALRGEAGFREAIDGILSRVDSESSVALLLNGPEADRLLEVARREGTRAPGGLYRSARVQLEIEVRGALADDARISLDEAFALLPALVRYATSLRESDRIRTEEDAVRELNNLILGIILATDLENDSDEARRRRETAIQLVQTFTPWVVSAAWRYGPALLERGRAFATSGRCCAFCACC